ncbi:MAG: hypothetical protein ACK56F_19505, partial [bacterium]
MCVLGPLTLIFSPSFFTQSELRCGPSSPQQSMHLVPIRRQAVAFRIKLMPGVSQLHLVRRHV